MAVTEQPTRKGINSIEIGARVLFALEEGRGPLSLTDVARRAELHPAKTHRYLTSLVRTGLASQDPTTGFYDLGPRSRHLGIEALRRTNAVSTVSAHAVELREQTGHTVNVAVWTDQGPTLVRWDTGAYTLPILLRVGSVLPLLDSAIGCVFLAHLPASVTRQALRQQQRDQTTRRATAAEVEEIKTGTRRARYSRTTNQMIVGLGALAAPVFGADGALEVVIGLILPSGMMTEAEVRRLVGVLAAVTERISAELGFSDTEAPGP